MGRGKPRSWRRRAVREEATAPDYDLSRAPRSVSPRRCGGGTGIVLLDADVAAAFPDPAAVNEALRALVRVAERLARRRRLRA
jgi:hypothetical protein